jgi:DNA-binding GntR family transcriptional regulator
VQADIPKPIQIDTVPIQPMLEGDKDNNTTRAYREIRRRILNSEMAAGKQYLEQELAEMLGMSRTPVREALIRLSDEKLVEVRPRHGARVLSISASDMAEIYEILTELETTAIRRVATNGLSDADVAALDAGCIQMVAAAKAGDNGAWIQLDQDFHLRLMAAAGNARMVEIVRGLLDQVHRVRRQALVQYQAQHASNTEHAALMDAIRRRDPKEAERLQRAHRQRIESVLVSQLKQAKNQG